MNTPLSADTFEGMRAEFERRQDNPNLSTRRMWQFHMRDVVIGKIEEPRPWGFSQIFRSCPKRTFPYGPLVASSCRSQRLRTIGVRVPFQKRPQNSRKQIRLVTRG